MVLTLNPHPEKRRVRHPAAFFSDIYGTTKVVPSREALTARTALVE